MASTAQSSLIMNQITAEICFNKIYFCELRPFLDYKKFATAKPSFTGRKHISESR